MPVQSVALGDQTVQTFQLSSGSMSRRQDLQQIYKVLVTVY
jgi:hypothetical protein